MKVVVTKLEDKIDNYITILVIITYAKFIYINN